MQPQRGGSPHRPGAVDERLLLVAGELQDFIARKAEGLAQIEARLRQIFDERCREWAVLAVAVGGGRSRLGGKRNQRVGPGRLNPGKPTLDRARAHRAFHALCEGIVATGIQNHEPQFPGGFDDRQQSIERDGFVEGVDIAFQHGIGGNQIVCTIDLNAVTGKKHDGNVGIPRGIRKIAKRATHFASLEIVLRLHDVETGLLQRCSHCRRIVGRIGQLSHMLVSGIAYHQRDPAVRKGGIQAAAYQNRAEQRRADGPFYQPDGPNLAHQQVGRLLHQALAASGDLFRIARS